jgi:hypothetical protein
MAVQTPVKMDMAKLKQIALVLIQNQLESNAKDLSDIEWLKDGWRVEYTSGNIRFELKFIASKKTFIKGPLDAEEPTNVEFSEAAEEADESASFAESVINFEVLFAMADAAPEFGNWGDQIDELLAGSDTLEEFAAELPGIYEDLPIENHAEFLAAAMTAASMAGLV